MPAGLAGAGSEVGDEMIDAAEVADREVEASSMVSGSEKLPEMARMRRWSSGVVASSWWVRVSESLSRPVRTMRAPSSRRVAAMARPMPREEPATKTTWSVRLRFMFLQDTWARRSRSPLREEGRYMRSDGGPAAVDVEVLAGDVGAGVGGEEEERADRARRGRPMRLRTV